MGLEFCLVGLLLWKNSSEWSTQCPVIIIFSCMGDGNMCHYKSYLSIRHFSNICRLLFSQPQVTSVHACAEQYYDECCFRRTLCRQLEFFFLFCRSLFFCTLSSQLWCLCSPKTFSCNQFISGNLPSSSRVLISYITVWKVCQA